MMRLSVLASLLAFPVSAAAQTDTPGRWDVTFTIVELVAPDIPGFMQRMTRGRSSSEHKLLSPGQGVQALLAPDPKAPSTVDSERIADNRYAQALTCRQRRGERLRVVRAGTYDASGFVGQATVTGTTSKGALRIALDQHTARPGG
jgi:hypothetical protein